ncbi:MAG: gliding motility-associated C-terminal domain-containing protein [Chitinophagales bacterium]
MKKLYAFAICSLFLVHGWAQCTTQLVGNNFCNNAPFINACLLGGGNCIGSNNSSLTSQTPGNLATAFCGSIENNQFYQFTASATSVTFTFNASGCANGDGIQGMVMSSPDCQNFTSVVCDGAGSTSFSITATPLVVGQTYYLMIDGFAGDVCTGIQLTSSNGISSGVSASSISTTPATCGSNDGTASFTGTGGIGPYTVAIDGSTTFVPATGVTGLSEGTHTYVIHDAFGCTGSGTFTIGVNKTVASADQNYCTGGGPVTLTATGGSLFHWRPLTGIISASPDSSSIQVAPSVTTTYVVTSNLPSPCKNKDTVVITNVSTFSASIAVSQDTICLHASTQITVSPTPLSEGPFTYNWKPANVLNDSTTSTVTATPFSDTKFTVTIVSASGCTVHDTADVFVRGVAPALSVFSTRDNLCLHDTVTLLPRTVFTDLVQCGVIPISNACLTPGPQPTVKLGTTTTGGTTATPFFGLWEGGHTQYIYRASELQAMGLYSGTFTTIGFYVTTKGSAANFNYNNFQIKMSCTTRDSLTGFVPGLPVVFQPQTIQTTTGLNTFDLTDPYNWDGHSNIIVEVCYDNTATTFDANDQVELSTFFNGASAYDFGDNVAGCNQLTPTITNSRPNTYFAMCNPAVNLTYNWTGVTPTPTSTLSDPNIANPVATVDRDQSYQLTVADGNCTASANVTVHVNPAVFINVRDTALCGGGAIDTAQLVVVQPNPSVPVCAPSYTVASTPYATIAPTGATTSITTTGGNDDGYANNLAIPFPFQFYCNTYNTFSFSTNGFITFNNLTSSPFGNVAIPNNGTPNNYIAAYWDDLVTATRDYFTVGTAPNRILVVRWVNARLFGGSATFNAEIHLYEGSNQVETMISAFNAGTGTKTIGVENATGTAGTPAPGRNNVTTAITANEGWRFTPQTTGLSITGIQWNPTATIIGSSTDDTATMFTTVTQDYGVEVTFSNGCISRDTGRVTIGNFPFIGVTATPDSICVGGSSQLAFNGTGAISYQWSPAASLNDSTLAGPTATPLSTTTYSVTATNNQGCTVSGSANVVVRTHAPISLNGPFTVCYNNTAPLSPNGGPYNSFNWYDIAQSAVLSTDPSFDAAPGSSYYVDVNDGYCVYRSDTADVLAFPAPVVTVGPDTSICPGDSVLLTATAGFVTYTWNASTSNANTAMVQSPGNYFLTITDANNCTYYSDTAVVGFYNVVRPLVTPSVSNLCPGDSALLMASSGYSNILWNTTSTATSFYTSVAGSYWYSARDVHTCLVQSDTAQVNQKPLPVIDFAVPKNPICSTDTIVIDAGQEAGVLYTWQPGSVSGATLTVNQSGTYSVRADLNGCIKDSSVTIGGLASPVLSLPSVTNRCSCDTGATISVTVVSGTPTSYQWSGNAGSVGNVNQIVANQSGVYTVTALDGNNCSAVASGAVNLYCLTAGITLSNPADTAIFIGDSAQLTAVSSYTNDVHYVWSPAGSVSQTEGLQTATLSDSTLQYRLEVMDTVHGCRAFDTLTVLVRSEGRFVMPTAFTPNGDGKNDRMYPVLNGGSNSAAKVTLFRIYNRWGEQVYNSPEAPGWDGTTGGQAQPSETYTYLIQVEVPKAGKPNEKETLTAKGSFLLWR